LADISVYSGGGASTLHSSRVGFAGDKTISFLEHREFALAGNYNTLKILCKLPVVRSVKGDIDFRKGSPFSMRKASPVN
jgi:hypothetical protein